MKRKTPGPGKMESDGFFFENLKFSIFSLILCENKGAARWGELMYEPCHTLRHSSQALPVSSSLWTKYPKPGSTLKVLIWETQKNHRNNRRETTKLKTTPNQLRGRGWAVAVESGRDSYPVSRINKKPSTLSPRYVLFIVHPIHPSDSLYLPKLQVRRCAGSPPASLPDHSTGYGLESLSLIRGMIILTKTLMWHFTKQRTVENS